MAYKDLKKGRAATKARNALRTKEQRHAEYLRRKSYMVAYNKKHAARNKATLKRCWLKNKYGLTVEQHQQMYFDQKGCCALCGNPIKYEKVDTDHNHITGEIRGLTCHQCNTGLGMFFVDEKGIEILTKAIKYLGEQNECSK